MPITIRVWDEVVPGRRFASDGVTLRDAATTPRELIRSRVQQEVDRYNQNLPEEFHGLIQPEESEQILNGFRMKTKRPLDGETQCQRACASFERNGFLLLVDGRQVSDLDEPLHVGEDSEVQFIKMVPLVGG